MNISTRRLELPPEAEPARDFIEALADGTDPTPEFTADRQRIVPVFQACVSIHESLSCLVSAPDPQEHGLPGQMLGFAIGDVLKIDTRRC